MKFSLLLHLWIIYSVFDFAIALDEEAEEDDDYAEFILKRANEASDETLTNRHVRQKRLYQ